jgi:hypothetical protein
MSSAPCPVLLTDKPTRNLTCDMCFLCGLRLCFLCVVRAERVRENTGMGIDLSSEVPREQECDQKKN